MKRGFHFALVLAASFTLSAAEIRDTDLVTLAAANVTDLQHEHVGRGSDDYEEFGAAIASDGDLLVVGAPGDDVGTITQGGSVYVYRRILNEWTFEARLDNPAVSALSRLGHSVAVEGNVIVAGAPDDKHESLSKVGSVTVFRHNGLEWEAVGYFKGDVAGDRLGEAVALSNGREAVWTLPK